ncbi:MAG: hypothetical protein AAB353_11235 [Candidatus Hydrogenedentota bacterium]
MGRGNWRQRISVRSVLALKFAGVFAPLIALGLIAVGLWNLYGPGAAALVIGAMLWVDGYLPSSLRSADDKPKAGTHAVIGRTHGPLPFAPSVDPHEPMRY